MNALFLSGESLYNKTWIEQVVDKLSPLFETSVLHTYRHWEQGGGIDFEYELPRVIEEASDLKPYVIFAKSAGSVLSMLGVARGVLDPQYCVFVGVPLTLAKRTDDSLAAWARSYQRGSLFIQNDHDPVTGANELAEYLAGLKLKDSELITLPGDSHSYPDLATVFQLVQSHLSYGETITATED
jgi:hypothetical protein